MATNQSLISIVMAVKDGCPYLSEAIESIQHQTHADFEFIIVDDGSTDGTDRVLAEAARSDPRIRLLVHERRGLAACLNRAIDDSIGTYIARMDADDVSLPNRLEAQLNAIQRIDCDVLGGAIRYLGGASDGRMEVFPQRDEDIKFRMLFRSPLAHPTVFGKAESFRKARYREDVDVAQDLELWTRMAVSGVRFGNIPEVCLLYRISSGQVTAEKSHNQLKSADQCAARVGEVMFGILPDRMGQIRRCIRHGERASEIVRHSRYLCEIAVQNHVSAEWGERPLFALARRTKAPTIRLACWGVAMLREWRYYSSVRLCLLYAVKLIPFTNSPYLLAFLSRVTHQFRLNW